MKKLKWTTEVVYVERETGQVLTKQDAKDNYIITKIHKHARVVKEWRNLKYGGQILEERGITTYTNECTRTGTQGRLF